MGDNQVEIGDALGAKPIVALSSKVDKDSMKPLGRKRRPGRGSKKEVGELGEDWPNPETMA